MLRIPQTSWGNMEHPEQAGLVPDVDLATVAYMLLEKQRDICYVSIEVANLMHGCMKKLKCFTICK